MASTCAHCNSADVQAGLDEFTCLNCGGQTHVDGRAMPRDPQFLVPQLHDVVAEEVPDGSPA